MFNHKPLDSLSADELSRALKSLNLNVGPITSSTRKIYENRLKDHLQKTEESTSADKITGDNIIESLTQVGDVAAGKNDAEINIERDNAVSDKIDIKTNDNCIEITNPQNFYAVWTPFSPKNENENKVPSVYSTQRDALAFMKENRGSRFKLFKTLEEAENFSISKPDKGYIDKIVSLVSLTTANNHNGNKMIFKSPTFHELQKFKKYIEEDNFIEIQNCLSNPRYLITSLDMPVILHEGCRHNAMHIAVRANKPHLCKYFIELLHSHEFLSLVFTDAVHDDLVFRERHLVDLFLNTPDKTSCDTILHTSCKFCYVDVVKFLLTCKEIDLKSKNKDGRTASEVIGQRAKKGDLQREIEDLFKEKAFIPLYKNDFYPQVGQPIVTLSPDGLQPSAEEIKAFVGPVTPAKAAQIYSIWKDTQRKSPVALSDIDKGLERLGREIADKEKVPFAEYWLFLNGFYNLSTKQGLQKLEDYLKVKSEKSQNLDYDSESPKESFMSSEDSSQRNEKYPKDDIKRKLLFDDETVYSTDNITDFENDINFDDESLEHNDCFVNLDFKELCVLFKTCSMRNKEMNVHISQNGHPISQDKLSSLAQEPFHLSSKNTVQKAGVNIVRKLIFIDGDTPTKADLDVLRAIKDVVLEPLQYPNIRRWKSYIESYSDSSKMSWPSPGSPRYHKSKKRTTLSNGEHDVNNY